MSNRRVSIIERVKRNGKWGWGDKWELPVRFTLKEGSRQGKFYILWYRANQKQFTPVPPAKEEKLPDLSGALRIAKIKQRHLEDAADGLQRPDPLKPVNRATIQEAVQKFVTQIELTKDPLTYKVYEQNLRQYLEWTNLTYVDQIDKDHLFEFRKHVVDGGNESLTADWKLLASTKNLAFFSSTLRVYWYRPPSINFSHDVLSPPSIGDCTDGRRNQPEKTLSIFRMMASAH
jgi:hypothetical protein